LPGWLVLLFLSFAAMLAAAPGAQAQVPSCAAQPAWAYGPIEWQGHASGPYRRCAVLISYSTNHGHYEQNVCEYRNSPGQYSCGIQISLSEPSPYGRCPSCTGGGYGGGIGQGGGFGGPGGSSPGGINSYCINRPDAEICKKLSK
jgi:hypothetical protein